MRTLRKSDQSGLVLVSSAKPVCGVIARVSNDVVQTLLSSHLIKEDDFTSGWNDLMLVRILCGTNVEKARALYSAIERDPTQIVEAMTPPAAAAAAVVVSAPEPAQKRFKMSKPTPPPALPTYSHEDDLPAPTSDIPALEVDHFQLDSHDHYDVSLAENITLPGFT